MMERIVMRRTVMKCSSWIQSVWPALFESLRWQLCRLLLRQLFFVSLNYYCCHSHRYCQCYSHYCHHHYYYCHYFCCAKKVHIMKLWKPWAFWFDTVRPIMYWPITKKIRIICYWYGVLVLWRLANLGSFVEIRFHFIETSGVHGF